MKPSHTANVYGAPTARRLFLSGERFDAETRAELEDRFFSSLKLRNGTYKHTRRGRLDDLDEFVNGLLPRGRPLRLMDVAVSSGVTTAAWARSLESAGFEFELVAGDAVVRAYHLSAGRNLGALLDPTGHALQLEVGGRAVRTPVGALTFLRAPLSILLLKAATRLLFPTLRRRCSRVAAGAPPPRLLGLECRRLDLVSSSLKELASVRLVEDDLLVGGSFEKCFDAVRAANILNRTYFDDAALASMVAHLRARLVPGGLLVVCRTDRQGVNNATAFALDGRGRFRALARMNEGADVEPLVLELPG